MINAFTGSSRDRYSFVTVTRGKPPAFRVDVANTDGERHPVREYSDLDETNRLAGWFGRKGEPHAEVGQIANRQSATVVGWQSAPAPTQRCGELFLVWNFLGCIAPPSGFIEHV